MALAQTINGALRRVPTWPVYALGALPPLWFLWLGLTGGLGVEPIKELEHRLGLLALQMMIATLAVTPLRRFTGVSLIRFRRALGLLAFYYICCHLLVWLVLDVGVLGLIWQDILKRPYITIGMAAFLLLVPLAATSNNRSVRRLGAPRWRRLHQLSYGAAILGAVHFVMLSKGFQIEPLAYLAAILVLLATRIELPRRRVAT
jgi:sulfoxide reductase heme-binding subunit YedZ